MPSCGFRKSSYSQEKLQTTLLGLQEKEVELRVKELACLQQQENEEPFYSPSHTFSSSTTGRSAPPAPAAPTPSAFSVAASSAAHNTVSAASDDNNITTRSGRRFLFGRRSRPRSEQSVPSHTEATDTKSRVMAAVGSTSTTTSTRREGSSRAAVSWRTFLVCGANGCIASRGGVGSHDDGGARETAQGRTSSPPRGRQVTRDDEQRSESLRDDFYSIYRSGEGGRPHIMRGDEQRSASLKADFYAVYRSGGGGVPQVMRGGSQRSKTLRADFYSTFSGDGGDQAESWAGRNFTTTTTTTTTTSSRSWTTNARWGAIPEIPQFKANNAGDSMEGPLGFPAPSGAGWVNGADGNSGKHASSMSVDLEALEKSARIRWGRNTAVTLVDDRDEWPSFETDASHGSSTPGSSLASTATLAAVVATVSSSSSSS